MPSHIVIGAGWAGLSCAYTLAKDGQEVTLIDAAPQVGGRARAVNFNQYMVDNGQHICIGAYHTTLKLMRELQLDPEDFFKTLPMELHTLGDHKLSLKVANLPAPWNLIWAVLTTPSLGVTNKYRVLTFCFRIQQMQFRLHQDCSVLELLKNYHQTDKLISSLWEPLALAAMSTPIAQGSAQIFLNIMQQTFTKNKNNSDWYLPSTDLTQLLPAHLEKYLLHNKCQIFYAQAIKSLTIEHGECLGAASISQTWKADHTILATPPWQAKSLVDMSALNDFNYQPITTIYFEFADKIAMPYPMLGLINRTCQWIFDRSFAGQPHILSAVISGEGLHQELDNAELANRVFAEILAIFPGLPALLNQRVIREKRAAFNCDVAIQPRRPSAHTQIKNLWLSGDYLQTGLPSTLEGAVLSGIQTGEAILENISPRSNHYC